MHHACTTTEDQTPSLTVSNCDAESRPQLGKVSGEPRELHPTIRDRARPQWFVPIRDSCMRVEKLVLPCPTTSGHRSAERYQRRAIRKACVVVSCSSSGPRWVVACTSKPARSSRGADHLAASAPQHQSELVGQHRLASSWPSVDRDPYGMREPHGLDRLSQPTKEFVAGAIAHCSHHRGSRCDEHA